MLKKTIVLMGVITTLALTNLQAANNQPNGFAQQGNRQVNPSPADQAAQRAPVHPDAARKDAIMQEDEVDPTDIYAIPLDSSEVEDDEEIERLERRGGHPR